MLSMRTSIFEPNKHQNTLRTMTHIRKITNTLAAVALACLTMTTVACSDDDDNATPNPDQ